MSNKDYFRLLGGDRVTFVDLDGKAFTGTLQTPIEIRGNEWHLTIEPDIPDDDPVLRTYETIADLRAALREILGDDRNS